MRFFGRKKEDFEEAAEPPEETEVPEKKQGSKSSYKLSAQVEKLKAKVDALGELRKADAERFTRISEQIGEMHNLILEKEKAIEEVNAKAVKAADLVAELRPESILAELRKASVKYEGFDAKIEAINSLYRKVLEELKSIRDRLSVFSGTEELVKLNRETAENLARIRKSDANIERNANKAGNVFIQLQKQFADFSKFREWFEGAEAELNKIKEEFDAVKLKADSRLVGHRDLEELRTEFQKEVGELQGSLHAGSGDWQSVNGRLNDFDCRLAALDEKILKLSESIEESRDSVERIKEDIILRKSEPETMESEYYRLAEEVKALAKRGPVYQAIVKYNVLKDMYGEIAGLADSGEKHSSLYAVLKEAFEAVNEASSRAMTQ